MIAIFGCLGFISVRRVKKYLSTLEIVGDRRIISGMTVRRWGRFVLLGIERVVGSEQLHVVLHFLSYTSFLKYKGRIVFSNPNIHPKKKNTHTHVKPKGNQHFSANVSKCVISITSVPKKKKMCVMVIVQHGIQTF